MTGCVCQNSLNYKYKTTVCQLYFNTVDEKISNKESKDIMQYKCIYSEGGKCIGHSSVRLF